MLHSRPPIMDEIFFDLTASLSLRRLIDGKFDSAGAILHYLTHQGRVIRTDIIIVEMGELAKSHYVSVKCDRFVHFTELDIADDMIDCRDSGLGSGWRVFNPLKAWQDTPIVIPLDKAVHRVAIGGDRCPNETSKTIFKFLRFLQGFAAAASRFVECRSRVMHAQRDVADAIAMGGDVLRYFRRGIWREWRSQKKLHLPPCNKPGSSIAHSGFKSGISDGSETKSSPIEMRCLPSVGYIKLDIIDA